MDIRHSVYRTRYLLPAYDFRPYGYRVGALSPVGFNSSARRQPLSNFGNGGCHFSKTVVVMMCRHKTTQCCFTQSAVCSTPCGSGSGYPHRGGGYLWRRINRNQVQRHAQPKAQGLDFRDGVLASRAWGSGTCAKDTVFAWLALGWRTEWRRDVATATGHVKYFACAAGSWACLLLWLAHTSNIYFVNNKRNCVGLEGTHEIAPHEKISRGVRAGYGRSN